MRELYGNVRKMKEWKKVPDCRRGHGMDERRSAIEGKRKYIKKTGGIRRELQQRVGNSQAMDLQKSRRKARDREI